ncbi:hypothetical protein HDV00_004739 [Rhizophlyctis rosea]|nr:hypothetical protein HDV00_004739 [Rhizophlyctis rosea]
MYENLGQVRNRSTRRKVFVVIAFAFALLLFPSIRDLRTACTTRPNTTTPSPTSATSSLQWLTGTHPYDTLPVPPIVVEETKGPGNTIRWTISPSTPTHSPRDINSTTVLILVLVQNNQSWGRNRTITNFWDMISTSTFPKPQTSFAFLVSDQEEYETMKRLTLQRFDSSPASATTTPFPHPGITIHYRPQDSASVSRDARHDNGAQQERRRNIARMRNVLLYSSLGSEEWVVWIDADIVRLPEGLVGWAVGSGKDIITARCRRGGMSSYDLNAWVGSRKVPTPEELQTIRNGGLFVPNAVPGNTKWLSDFRTTTDDPLKLVELDSVGATFLAVNADIHRQGIAFPTLYIIGTAWDSQGWDGIETEGFCYLAKTVGRKCWGYPNLEVVHDDS